MSKVCFHELCQFIRRAHVISICLGCFLFQLHSSLPPLLWAKYSFKSYIYQLRIYFINGF